MSTEHDNGLQRVGSAGMAAFEPRDFNELERLAKRCVDSRLFKVASPDAALVIMLTGASLGLSPVASLRGIHVIEGKSVLSSDLLVAVVLKSGQCQRWTVVETTPTRCVIEAHRKGQPSPHRHEWTMDMARRAGLDRKDNWVKYPGAMLRARCSSELARIVFPDVMFGVFVEGELDGDAYDAEPVDIGTVTVVRDDAPAQPAPVDALDAFRAALDGAESLDLDGARRVYAAHDLGGTSLSAVTVAVVGALAVRGYRLTGMEAGALLRGELPDALALAYDRLAAIDRHADDADGDGVVADVVRVLRASGSLPKAAKARLLKVAAQTIALELQVSDADAAARLDAALRPPPPPTGTDAPAANDAASAHGDAIAAAQTAGAQALRTVLDSDVAHITIAGTWRADPAQWEAHLAEKSVRRAVENSVACNGAALGPAFVALAAERIVALDALRPKPPGTLALNVINVTQTLERIAYDASRQRAALAAGEQRAA